eukprot:TRINITY_DN19373_c0_g1_i1.p1 TRINITY_DN19373_c0_g1~~TRINITY_DN19373_c0_g1_i1.p1  ORF type:complete len:524 (-),score=215.85 TRINITY_DN19373_c0_g1_i1:69-1640(-)
MASFGPRLLVALLIAAVPAGATQRHHVAEAKYQRLRAVRRARTSAALGSRPKASGGGGIFSLVFTQDEPSAAAASAPSEDELADLNFQEVSLEAQHADLQAEYDKDADTRAVKEKIAEEEKATFSVEHTLAEAEAFMAGKSRADAAEMNKLLANLTGERTTLTGERRKEAELEKHNQILKNLEQELVANQSRLTSQLEASLRVIEQDADHKRKLLLAKSETERKQLLAEWAPLKKNMTELTTNFTGEWQQLRSADEKLRAEKEKLEASLPPLRKQVQELREDAGELSEAVAAEQTTSDSLRAEHETSGKRNEEVENSKKELTEENDDIATMKEQSISLQARLNLGAAEEQERRQAQKDLANKRQELKQVSEDNAALKKQVAEAEEEGKALNAQLALASQRSHLLESQEEEVSESTKAWLEEKKAQAAEEEQLRQKPQDLNSLSLEVEELHEQLQALEAAYKAHQEYTGSLPHPSDTAAAPEVTASDGSAAADQTAAIGSLEDSIAGQEDTPVVAADDETLEAA